MVDIFSEEKRSFIMSRVRSRDTTPELVVRQFLHGNGFRYRLHGKNLPGKPDLVFPRFRTALFIHGCFWHRHSGCPRATTPKTREEFWLEKFKRNQRRDHENQIKLKELGWRVLVVWECEVQTSKSRVRRLEILRDELVQSSST